MHTLIKSALAIAAAGCLTLVTVHAAERGNSGEASSKHVSSKHRSSTTDSRNNKASSNRSSRHHKSHHTSTETRRNPDRPHGVRNPETIANDEPPPDVNVQVDLPSHENENENAIGTENDDENTILFGGGTVNNEGEPPL